MPLKSMIRRSVRQRTKADIAKTEISKADISGQPKLTSFPLPQLPPTSPTTRIAAMGRLSVPVLECAASELANREPLGAGTVSTVERAELHTLPVAVKTLRPLDAIADPQTRMRAPSDFQNEFELNAALRHPNIVLLIASVREQNLKSMVFEFCDGGTLHCREFGFARLHEGLAVCLGVARALCYAHRLGIIHRDVKPSQIVFSGGVPKLGDWGLAAYAKSESVLSGNTGTWEFMAPEVIRSEKYSTPADVYSFGILMYCIVTGEDYPYRDRYLTPGQAALAVAKKDLRPNIPSRMPEAIKQVITMCWAPDPQLRPTMEQIIFMIDQTCMSHSPPDRASRRDSNASFSTWLRGSD